jgi:ABC-2 type transport system ATP-binding protein
MAVLELRQLVKTKQNVVLLPAIDLAVAGGTCAAVQCNHEQGHLLIRLILGIVPASNGTIWMNGQKLPDGHRPTSRQIGVYFQEDGLYERLKVSDYLKFWAGVYGVRASIPDVLRFTGLVDQAGVVIAKLHDSEKRRVHFARMAVHDPDLIVMENPDQYLDIESRIIFRKLLAAWAERGKAILVTASSLESAISMTDDVYRLTESGLHKIETRDDAAEGGRSKATSHREEVQQVVHTSEPDMHRHEPNSSIENAQLAEDDEKTPDPISWKPLKLEKVPAKIDDKIILFDPTEIHFIESDEGVSRLHLNADTFPCAWTLNELEEKLKPFGFFRCHRSYIVNLQKVREVVTWTRNSYSLVLDDPKKSTIPLSKGKFDALKHILGI